MATKKTRKRVECVFSVRQRCRRQEWTSCLLVKMTKWCANAAPRICSVNVISSPTSIFRDTNRLPSAAAQSMATPCCIYK